MTLESILLLALGLTIACGFGLTAWGFVLVARLEGKR